MDTGNTAWGSLLLSFIYLVQVSLSTRRSPRGPPLFYIAVLLSSLLSSSSFSTSAVKHCQALSLSSLESSKSAYNKRLKMNKVHKVIGYCHDAYSDKIETAIQNGIDVIIWSFIHMKLDPMTQSPIIETDLEMDQIRNIRNDPRHKNLIHMAAFGGWNGPHPPSGVSGADWCRAFIEFNKKHENVFDGIDWDLEGHDHRETASTRKFTMEVLDVMAEFSREAKEKYDLLVSLAPAESYLDPLYHETADNHIAVDDHDENETNSFSLQLNLFPASWNQDANDKQYIVDAGFAHAGKQCYAYVLHKAGIHTFDWIAFQYYESFSRFLYDTTRAKPHITQMEALMMRANQLENGFEVDLPHMRKVTIRVPLEKIVFGFANGWADGIRSVQIDVNAVKDAFDKISHEKGKRHLGGVMFWTIEEEGKNGLYLAASLKNAVGENTNHIESTEF